MTLQQNDGFGRREAPRNRLGPVATSGSPLVKQAGGVLLGVAIALVLGFTFVQLMKGAGRMLDKKFVENATPGAPDEAIKRIKTADANLQSVHQTCAEQAKSAKLNLAQMRATDGYMELSSGEDELARGAAYVECLATTKPARFCQAVHKAHLVEAVRQYFKLHRQMREAWFIATGGPGGANKAALMGTPYRLEQRIALAMPSAVTSPPMLASLRALVADGYVSTRDLAGTGMPPELSEALSKVQPQEGGLRMSLVEQGLPASFFTRWRAVATGLFIGGAFIVVNEAYAKLNYYLSEPTTAPPCYGEAYHVAGTETIPARGARDRDGHSIDDRRPGYDLDRTTLAQRVCTPSACGREEWKAYRSAMFWYVSARLMHTSRLDRQYGDEGLARAHEIYSGAFDRQVEDGLRARYRAKLFRLNDFTQDRDAMIILVLKGGDALRPCRKIGAGVPTK